MRKMMMAIAALALSSGVAWGQTSATQTIGLSAGVLSYCSINGQAIGASVDALNVVIANGKAASQTLTKSIAEVTCTSGVKIKLVSNSGGLTNGSGTTTTVFTNKIHYTAVANYGLGTSTVSSPQLDTSSGIPFVQVENSSAVGSATTSGTLGVTITVISTGSKFLLDGTFHDDLVITLTPST
jgi:hypothetical protein